MLADVVSNTRELAKAVKDGRKFLSREHPEAKKDLLVLLSQMQLTVEGLADVTAVVTGFRFTVEGGDLDRQPARFNDYVVEQKKKIAELQGRIRELKGSSNKIREARDKLNEIGGDRSDWTAMFRLFDADRRELSTKLAGMLSNFYADDQRMLELIKNILSLSQSALAEADEALGPAGTASPQNVRIAATVLNIYADAFKQSEEGLSTLVKKLEDAVDALS
jgi:hypothetical protein